MAPAAPLVWFVTGCSSGFGRHLVDEILAAGHKLVATVRKPEVLADVAKQHAANLLVVKLDVTDAGQRQEAVAAALEKFGHVDVLVNNAGYGIVGALEETPESELRRMFETNVFGLVEMTRAFLPHFRARHKGHIINLSSVAGLVPRSGFSAYNGSKFAVEGISEALAQEVAPLGIRVTIVEPGPFRTDFASRSLVQTEPIADYAESVGPIRDYLVEIEGKQPGDPVRAARAMVAIPTMMMLPLRFPMGKSAIDRIRVKLGEMAKNITRMEKAAIATDFPDAGPAAGTPPSSP